MENSDSAYFTQQNDQSPVVVKNSTINAVVGGKRIGVASTQKTNHFQTLIILLEIHREVMQVVANNVPRHLLEKIYNIKLPKPKPYELQSRPPTAAELLKTCSTVRPEPSDGILSQMLQGLILKDLTSMVASRSRSLNFSSSGVSTPSLSMHNFLHDPSPQPSPASVCSILTPPQLSFLHTRGE
ncbi:large subunit GTPase 1 [Dendrobium catenatum]|uniref:Large subunit GTPase 1 n=1 Tax=Dendrobium catenatum TaxID=906689 RepID=A0A2I0WAC2_9ASPA|nr:large subunit GTPase 1 [Dendrobium catenatum]